MQLSWEMIEAAMPSFVAASGGYTLAKRGVVTLEDGRRVFIKLATEVTSQEFISAELKAYHWLQQRGYSHMPQLLLEKDDGFVLPDLSALDWANQWDNQKLSTTLAAMDELSALTLTEEDKKNLGKSSIPNGWQLFLEKPADFKKLEVRLEQHPEILRTIHNQTLTSLARKTDEYMNDTDQLSLIHADVRSDNLAYDAKNKKVYLIDWNWLGMGRKEVEDVAFLVNVKKSGFRVEEHCPERLDSVAATALMGFWFVQAITPIWEGGDPQLRTFQFENALICAKWARFF